MVWGKYPPSTRDLIETLPAAWALQFRPEGFWRKFGGFMGSSKGAVREIHRDSIRV